MIRKVLVCIFLLPSILLAESSVRFYNEFQTNNIIGPGSSSSYYEEGFSYLTESELFLDSALSSGLRYNFNLKLRLTDLSTVDKEVLSIENLKLWLGKDWFEASLGDVFLNFSQYSMNRVVKGISLDFKKGEESGVKLEVAGGIFDDQWEYLYKQVDSEPMDRRVVGVKLGYKKDAENSISLNYLYIWDDRDDKNRNGEDAYKQHIASVDWRLNLVGFELHGEHAFTNYKKYSLVGTRDDKDTFVSVANRLHIKKDIGYNLKWRAELERVEPDFVSLGGSYTPDRIRINNEFTFYLTRRTSLYFKEDYHENNLYNQLSSTTVAKVGEVGIKTKRLFGRRRLRLRLAYKVKDINDKYTTQWVKISGSDKISGFKVKARLEYLFQKNYGSENMERYHYDLSINKRFTAGSVTLKPYLDLLFDDVDIMQDTDTQNYRFGVNFYCGRSVDGSIGFERLENYIKGGVDGKVNRFFVSFGQSVGKFFWIKDLHWRADVRFNDYKYADGSQNYKENLFKLSLEWSI